MKRFSIVIAALCVALVPTRAEVTLQFSGNSLLDTSGDPLANGSLVLLLANVGTSSTSPTGFDTFTPGFLGIGEYLNAGRYQILGRSYVEELFSPGQFSLVTNSLTLGSGSFPHLNTGDQLAIAWFPTLIGSSEFGDEDFELLNGTSYGLFTIADDLIWQIPADGTVLTDFSAVPDDSIANLTVSAIPEPSTYAAIFGLGVLGFAIYRRRRR